MARMRRRGFLRGCLRVRGAPSPHVSVRSRMDGRLDGPACLTGAGWTARLRLSYPRLRSCSVSAALLLRGRGRGTRDRAWIPSAAPRLVRQFARDLLVDLSNPPVRYGQSIPWACRGGPRGRHVSDWRRMVRSRAERFIVPCVGTGGHLFHSVPRVADRMGIRWRPAGTGEPDETDRAVHGTALLRVCSAGRLEEGRCADVDVRRDSGCRDMGARREHPWLVYGVRLPSSPTNPGARGRSSAVLDARHLQRSALWVGTW